MALDPTLPAFFMPPNWREQLLERLQFRTDAIVSEDYTTQTRATRLTPRRSLEYTVGADADLRRRFANATYARGGRRWYLPVWMDGVELLAPATAGSDTIAASTALRDFATGGALFIQSPDLATFELIEIADVGLLTVTLAGVLANAYPRGSTIYPAVKARLDLQFSQNAFTSGSAYGRGKFNVVEPNHYGAFEWPTMHRGFPVLEDRPETNDRDPETVFQWMLDGLDDEIGIPSYRDPVGVPLYRQAHDWTLPTRAAINRFRSMAYALEGKRGSIWVPTWADDLVLSQPYDGGTTPMRVRACGAVALSGMVNRRDFRIETRQGGTTNVRYGRVNTITAGAAGVEHLNLGAERPGWPVAQDQTLQISWMALCRSETDNFEFNYFSGEAATVAMAWRARQNDV